jgi:hypothetical protein
MNLALCPHLFTQYTYTFTFAHHQIFNVYKQKEKEKNCLRNNDRTACLLIVACLLKIAQIKNQTPVDPFYDPS